MWCRSWNLGYVVASGWYEAWSRDVLLFGHQPHQKLWFNVLLGEKCAFLLLTLDPENSFNQAMHFWSVYESLNLLPEFSRPKMCEILVRPEAWSSSSFTPSFTWHDCRKGWQPAMFSLDHDWNQLVSRFSFTLTMLTKNQGNRLVPSQNFNFLDHFMSYPTTQ